MDDVILKNMLYGDLNYTFICSACGSNTDAHWHCEPTSTQPAVHNRARLNEYFSRRPADLLIAVQIIFVHATISSKVLLAA